MYIKAKTNYSHFTHYSKDWCNLPICLLKVFFLWMFVNKVRNDIVFFMALLATFRVGTAAVNVDDGESLRKRNAMRSMLAPLPDTSNLPPLRIWSRIRYFGLFRQSLMVRFLKNSKKISTYNMGTFYGNITVIEVKYFISRYVIYRIANIDKYS